METIFLKVLDMSLTAAWVIAAVWLIRLLLKGAPRKYSLLLWSAVGFRLVCPVSFYSIFSIFSVGKLGVAASAVRDGLTPLAARLPAAADLTGTGSALGSPASQALPAATAAAQQAAQNAGPLVNAAPAVQAADVANAAASVNPAQIWLAVGTAVWLIGVAAMVLWAVMGLIRLRRRMATAVRAGEGVYLSDRVRSPFVLGYFKPRIYIPYGLSTGEREYILRHERCHIRRGDHFVKLLAYLLLAVHWFNPLIWLASILMNRDMEMSCDEQVLSRAGAAIAGAYSLSLVSFAANRRLPILSPTAFGETSVKKRVKHVLKYKKPRRLVTVAAALLCAVALVACAANPPAGGEGTPAPAATPNPTAAPDTVPAYTLPEGEIYTNVSNYDEFIEVSQDQLRTSPYYFNTLLGSGFDRYTMVYTQYTAQGPFSWKGLQWEEITLPDKDAQAVKQLAQQFIYSVYDMQATGFIDDVYYRNIYAADQVRAMQVAWQQQIMTPDLYQGLINSGTEISWIPALVDSGIYITYNHICMALDHQVLQSSQAVEGTRLAVPIHMGFANWGFMKYDQYIDYFRLNPDKKLQPMHWGGIFLWVFMEEQDDGTLAVAGWETSVADNGVAEAMIYSEQGVTPVWNDRTKEQILQGYRMYPLDYGAEESRIRSLYTMGTEFIASLYGMKGDDMIEADFDAAQSLMAPELLDALVQDGYFDDYLQRIRSQDVTMTPYFASDPFSTKRSERSHVQDPLLGFYQFISEGKPDLYQIIFKWNFEDFCIRKPRARRGVQKSFSDEEDTKTPFDVG